MHFIDENETDKLLALPIGLVAGKFPSVFCDPKEILRVKNLICIQPYRWEPEHDGWFEGDCFQKIPIDSYDLHLHVRDNQAVNDENIEIILRQFIERNKLPEKNCENIMLLIDEVRNKNLNFAVLYGLHQIIGINNIEDVIYCLAKSYCEVSGKRTVLLILSDIIKFIEKCSVRCKELNTVHFSEISGSQPWSSRTELTKPDVDIVFCGRLPKPIFEYLVELSNLPVLLEGANTYQLVQNKGKNHLLLRPHGWTLPRYVEDFSEASKKLIHCSICLGFHRYILDKVSKSYSLNKRAIQFLKDSFCSFVKAKKHLPSYADLQEFLSCLPKDNLTDVGFFDVLFLFFRPSVRYLSNFYLIKKFFSSQGECVVSENDQDLLIKLIQEDKLVDFKKFLEEETISSLKDFIVSSLEEDSEISRMSKYLQDESCKPENNKLLQILDHIPEKLLVES
ncbi:hypothetical protein M3P05_04030 [Sansalvadorimonas sp. 2012CJ34-2]|uniref:Uncharacterized protein n=1 Tax=Parendozoicomonas callyspongiae TaxID=2942213 RepID=A0ABT0PCQ6_9GAMM|nr:hypothetical protein [Sansalvadorimonas sp. 2012CJ34-2]MCL6269110.1 hypothetical protein [Sansalvadorimonas sp. 2012CJ34-2]